MFRYKLIRVRKGNNAFPKWYVRVILKLVARTYEMRVRIIRWMIDDLAKHKKASPYSEWMVLRALVVSARIHQQDESRESLKKSLAVGLDAAWDDSLWDGDAYVIPNRDGVESINYGNISGQWGTIRAIRAGLIDSRV